MPPAKTSKVSSTQARGAGSLSCVCHAQWPLYWIVQTKTSGAVKKAPAAKATPAATTADPVKVEPAKAEPKVKSSTTKSKAKK